jgi:hypothetical protein
LPQEDIGADSEMPLAERHEVREEEVGVGAYVMWLEAVCGVDREEELGAREREAALHPSFGEDAFFGIRLGGDGVFVKAPIRSNHASFSKALSSESVTTHGHH